MNLINNTNKPKIRTRPTFDFVSPRSLDICAEVLRYQAGHKTSWVLGVTSIYELNSEVQMVDDDTYWFALQWNAIQRGSQLRLPFPYASVSGYLKRWEGNTTYVTGHAYISKLYIFVGGAVALSGLGILIFKTIADFSFVKLFMFLPIMVTILLLTLTLRQLRRKLVDIIKTYLNLDNPHIRIQRDLNQPYSNQPEAINEIDQQQQQTRNSHQGDL